MEIHNRLGSSGFPKQVMLAKKTKGCSVVNRTRGKGIFIQRNHFGHGVGHRLAFSGHVKSFSLPRENEIRESRAKDESTEIGRNAIRKGFMI